MTCNAFRFGLSTVILVAFLPIIPLDEPEVGAICCIVISAAQLTELDALLVLHELVPPLNCLFDLITSTLI